MKVYKPPLSFFGRPGRCQPSSFMLRAIQTSAEFTFTNLGHLETINQQLVSILSLIVNHHWPPAGHEPAKQLNNCWSTSYDYYCGWPLLSGKYEPVDRYEPTSYDQPGMNQPVMVLIWINQLWNHQWTFCGPSPRTCEANLLRAKASIWGSSSGKAISRFFLAVVIYMVYVIYMVIYLYKIAYDMVKQ